MAVPRPCGNGCGRAELRISRGESGRTGRAGFGKPMEGLQLDGSHHDWFEGRGPPCALMAYIDDASGRVFARFYEYEGTIPALDSFER
jgi:hypothetical protein